MPGRSEVHHGAAAPAPLRPTEMSQHLTSSSASRPSCPSRSLTPMELEMPAELGSGCAATLSFLPGCDAALMPRETPRQPPKPPPATRGLHSVGQLSWSRQSSRWLSGQSAGGRAGWMASAGKPALPRAVTTLRHAVTPSGTRSPPSGTRSPPPGMRSWLVRPGGGERALSEGGSTYGPSKPPLGVDTASHLPHSVGQNKS